MRLVIMCNWEKLNSPICLKIAPSLACLENPLLQRWNLNVHMASGIETEHPSISTLYLIHRNCLSDAHTPTVFHRIQRTSLERWCHRHHFSHPKSLLHTPQSHTNTHTLAHHVCGSFIRTKQKHLDSSKIQNCSFILMLGGNKVCTLVHRLEILPC